MAELFVAVAVHDGVEDGAGHAHQVAADEQLDHRLAVHALRSRARLHGHFLVVPLQGHFLGGPFFRRTTPASIGKDLRTFSWWRNCLAWA